MLSGFYKVENLFTKTRGHSLHSLDAFIANGSPVYPGLSSFVLGAEASVGITWSGTSGASVWA